MNDQWAVAFKSFSTKVEVICEKLTLSISLSTYSMFLTSGEIGAGVLLKQENLLCPPGQIITGERQAFIQLVKNCSRLSSSLNPTNKCLI